MIITLVKLGITMGLFSMVSATTIESFVPLLSGLHAEVSSLMEPVINTVKSFFVK